jgi:polar amino acid transport system substrate-binding protein
MKRGQYLHLALEKHLSAAFFGAIIAVVTMAECAHVQAQQVLRVGLQDAEPGLIRNNTNQLGGRDIEMWNAIAKDAGLGVTYVIMNNVATLFPAMDEGKVDVVSGVARTPETQSKYNLTGTLFLTAEALVVPKSDTRMYRGLDDIKGLNFATLRGSAYANYLKQVGIAGFKEFETTPAVLNAVSAGQANAAIFSGIIAGYLLKQGKFPDLQVVASYQPALARPIMAAFPKTATESFNKVNASIQKLTTDGTFRKILANYGQ